MILTSIWNLVYIIQRSLFYNNYGYKYMHSNVRQQNNISINYFESMDQFEETYRTFLHSFLKNYLSISNSRNISLNYCPPIPPDLRGPLTVNEVPIDFSLRMNSSYHHDVKFGGYYQPKTCVARHKVAIIVPYRDRREILRHFLFHTHQILQRQQLDYRIYVCEQAFNKTFNKGIVMNSCFKEILKFQPDTPCFIMHDVDLLLIDDRNMYTCPTFPRHLSVAIDKFRFYLPYTSLVGGVLGMKYFPDKRGFSVFYLAMRREHYLLVNGYSTEYWGWGGEDDDMYARIISKELKVERPPASIARYKMLKHTHQKLNPARMKFLRTAQTRINSDGVNNVKYHLLSTSFYHLYTHFLIDVGEAPK
jgi:hypothetical protein